MAVYTVLTTDEIAKFIGPYGIGSLLSADPVTEGVENSNYFVTTEHARVATGESTEPVLHCVLTVFEEITIGDLTLYLDWLDLLAAEALPVPAAFTDRFGTRIHLIEGKPAALFPRLPGRHPDPIDTSQCAAIGDALARIHAAAVPPGALTHGGPRGTRWLERAVALIRPSLRAGEGALVDKVIEAFEAAVSSLPKGFIHGDLFPDNTLFEGAQLTGLLDFYRGGHGALLLDLAITVNAWCCDVDGRLDPTRAAALTCAYRQRRPLKSREVAAWPAALEAAAARFWISRLASRLEPALDHRPGALVEPRDPAQYRTILQRHRECPASL